MSDELYNKLNWLSRIMLPKLATFLGVVSGIFIGYGINNVGMWFAIAAAVISAADTLVSEVVQAKSTIYFKDKMILEISDPVTSSEEEVVGE